MKASSPVARREEDLVRLARNGHEGAFREVADAYRGELHVHCYRILDSVQDAEDLVQETLLAAWRGLDRFEGRSSLRSWFYRIATNRCLNALRARGRRLPEMPPPPEQPPEPPPPTREREAMAVPCCQRLVRWQEHITGALHEWQVPASRQRPEAAWAGLSFVHKSGSVSTLSSSQERL
jgi:DNA-directed RNA polymerase specialized sigma24 family protein